MSRLTRWLTAKSSAPVSPPRFRPRLQSLDDRIVPSFLTTLASTNGGGSQVAASTFIAPALSADGRYVAFLSTAALVADDTNNAFDVYRKDRTTGEVVLVSRADGANGAAGNGNVFDAPSISADGRFVAFSSSASNLAGTDPNGTNDVFVRDTANGTTTLVSVRPDGNVGNGDSTLPHISADGRFVSFASTATNLVSGVTTAGINVFHRDLAARTTGLVSAAADGTQQNTGANANARVNAITADGRYVAFRSSASNLVAGDTNGQDDAFVVDTTTSAVVRVSVATDGTQGNGSSGDALDISGDGRFVAFTSDATTFGAGNANGVRDVFLYDRVANTTTLASADAGGTAGNGGSFAVAISGNGRFVAFASDSNNLVAGDGNGVSDVFVKDRVTGAITRVSVSTVGTEGNSTSGGFGVAVSRDGQFVAYDSSATSLAPDTNATADIFVTQRPLPVSYAVGVAAHPTASPLVNVFGPTGQTNSFLAYPVEYKGGVFVSMGDVTGDGIADVVTSTGPGGTANVRVYNTVGSSQNNLPLVTSFFAYPQAFLGGVNVAIGDVNNDGFADIVCGVGKGGGPNVRILDGKALLALAAKNDGSLEKNLLNSVANGGALLASFFAYVESFTGGVRVAVADVDGDGFADVICGVGSGGGPNVRVFNAKTLLAPSLAAFPNPTFSFFALTPAFTGGVFVGSGDFNNDGTPDMLVGVESGGGPAVTAIDGKKFNQANNVGQTTAQLASFFGFSPNQTGGIHVAGTDLDQDGFADFIVGTGPGTAGLVRGFSGKTGGQILADSVPFGANFTSGINVG